LKILDKKPVVFFIGLFFKRLVINIFARPFFYEAVVTNNDTLGSWEESRKTEDGRRTEAYYIAEKK